MESSACERTLQEAMKLWVVPEIARRKRAGTLGADFNLVLAQIIFSSPLDQSGIKVRLNEEVRVRAIIKSNREIKPGEIIHLGDIEDVEQVDLTEDEKNFAHFTIIKVRHSYVVAFDFRYNKQRVRQHIEVARQFIELARFSRKKEFWNAFVDNLFSAAELLAKSDLLLLPYPQMRSHRAIRRKYSAHTKLGNVNIIYNDALNRLSGLRDSARYLKQSFKLNKQDSSKYLQTVQEMLDCCLARLELRAK